MPAVFIHGVPDTVHVWDSVFSQLARTDLVALQLPGFDVATPRDFSASKEDYINWIIQALEAIGKPVNLVGHDWGCLFTTRVVTLRPDLVRTWAAGSGPVSAGYEWHPLAKVWQTPEKGEQWMLELDPAKFSQQLQEFGIPSAMAREMASRVDERMKQAILPLYRSALHVGEQWQPDLGKVSSPGLVFWGEQDEACPIGFADELARDTRAERVLKLNCGHWTPVQKPKEVAEALEAHWNRRFSDLIHDDYRKDSA